MLFDSFSFVDYPDIVYFLLWSDRSLLSLVDNNFFFYLVLAHSECFVWACLYLDWDL